MKRRNIIVFCGIIMFSQRYLSAMPDADLDVIDDIDVSSLELDDAVDKTLEKTVESDLAAKGAGVSPGQSINNQKDTKAESAEGDDLEAEDLEYSGNWVKKREFLLRSQELLVDIKKEMTTITTSKEDFSKERTKAAGLLEEFYSKMGLSHGKTKSLFESIATYLAKEKKKRTEEVEKKKETHALSAKEALASIEAIDIELKTYQRDLDQLKLDIQSIQDLDASIQKKIEGISDQIKEASSVEKKAYEAVERIWNIVNHKKAREIYYEIQGNLLEKIKSMSSFLSQTLLENVQSSVTLLETQIKKAQKDIESLEQKGIIIKQRSSRVDQIKQENVKKAEQEKAAKNEAAKKEQQTQDNKNQKKPVKKPQKQASSWFDWMPQVLQDIIGYVLSFF